MSASDTPRTRSTISVNDSDLESLRKVMNEIEPHEHYEGMNECRICDEHIIIAATRLLTDLRERLAAAEKDAARFNHLQNIPVKDAQAFFWNYGSRTERRKAIDDARKELP